MMRLDLAVRNASMLAVVLAAFAVVALSVVLIVGSVKGVGSRAFGFEKSTVEKLAGDADIAGWASFDQDSFLPGDRVGYRVRILWRSDVVTPDLETFESSINFFPYDYIDRVVDERDLPNGIREYVVDYRLQAVNVDSPASYEPATATVYYTSSRIDGEQLQALRINSERSQIGGFYPLDVSGISLKAPKRKIRDPRLLRQGLMIVFGFAIVALTIFLLWNYGRKRSFSKLTEAEQLWHESRSLRPGALDSRQQLVERERIFARALQLRAGISPADFWSGQGLQGSKWKKLSDAARSLFKQAYRPVGPTDDDLERTAVLIDELIDPLVSTDRLRREQQPSFAERLRQQPSVIATGAVMATVAVILFILAILPSSWVSEEALRYNQAIDLVEDDATLQQGFAQLSTLAGDAANEEIRAAAFYNIGTLATDTRLTGRLPSQQRELLHAIFLTNITLNQLLHTLDLTAEPELLTILTDSVRRYVQGELAMKAAVRIDPDDADIRRNLEILGKVRRAFANTILQLVKQGEQDSGPGQMQSQTITDLIRLMEMELPEDFAQLEEGKDDRNYFILERF